MKCRDCGQEGFKNIGEVNRHKGSDCPARAVENAQEAIAEANEALEKAAAAVEVQAEASNESPLVEPVKEPASLEAIQRMATELGIGFLIVKESRYLVIPKRFLPDEVKYLGNNAYMGIRMRGYLGPEGLVVQEKVEFLR